MQREQGDCPASRPGLRGAEAVLSLLCGLLDSRVKGRKVPQPRSWAHLWAHTDLRWRGHRGQQRGRKTGARGLGGA